jgi:hypothetical protein
MKIICLLIFLVMAAGIGQLHADMVILKSGEMFRTPKAWKAGDIVHYYKNGRLVGVDASEVERLIHSSMPHESSPPAENRPAGGLPSADHEPKIGQRYPQPGQTEGEIGYLGLRWGQAPAAINGLVHVATDPAYGGVAQYSLERPHPHFGRASVDGIYFGFWHGALYTVLVEVSNFLDYMDLKDEVFRRFGKGTPIGNDEEHYFWSDATSDRLLSYNDKTRTGYLWLRSQSIQAKVKTLYPK